MNHKQAVVDLLKRSDGSLTIREIINELYGVDVASRHREHREYRRVDCILRRLRKEGLVHRYWMLSASNRWSTAWRWCE